MNEVPPDGYGFNSGGRNAAAAEAAEAATPPVSPLNPPFPFAVEPFDPAFFGLMENDQ